MANKHVIYGQGCKSLEAKWLYEQYFPHRVITSHTTFSDLHVRLTETGSFCPNRHETGRPSSERTP